MSNLRFCIIQLFINSFLGSVSNKLVSTHPSKIEPAIRFCWCGEACDQRWLWIIWIFSGLICLVDWIVPAILYRLPVWPKYHLIYKPSPLRIIIPALQIIQPVSPSWYNLVPDRFAAPRVLARNCAGKLFPPRVIGVGHYCMPCQLTTDYITCRLCW